MNPFFRSHEPYDDVALDNICPCFHPPRYPTDGEFNSNTRLTPTYAMESNPLEPFYPSMIHLSLDSSSSSSAGQALLPVHGHGFIRTCAIPCGCGRAVEEDVEMMHPVVSGTGEFHSTDDLDSTCRTRCKNSPFY